MIEQKRLSELNKDDEITAFLIITKSEVKTAKNGKPFLNLELRDQTAAFPAKVWSNFEEIFDKIKEGAIVKVGGIVEEWNGTLQIRVDKIRLANENDNVSSDDFLPKSTRPLNEMIEEFNSVIGSIVDPYLSMLLKKIFVEENFAKFCRAPAGKSWHHAYIHGLLEHTLEIVKLCNQMTMIHPELNRDLLITGALLHDFGKTEELNYETSFDYTDKGKLIGHIVLSAIEIEKNVLQIPNFPHDLKNQLIHLVLSHQGKLEFASPVEPKTLEAIVLYQADELSAKTNAYKFAIAADKNRGNKWTRFLQLANTSLYIPDNNQGEEQND